MLSRARRPYRWCMGTRCGETPRRGYSTSKNDSASDEETDVLVIGSGAAGLTATLRCKSLSLRSILVEKSEHIGGTSALSGGGLWVPNSPFTKNDSTEKALEYMNCCIGDVGPASSPERRRAFVENAPQMLEFLRKLGWSVRSSGGFPNYHPDFPGGEVYRSVESTVFNAKKLGGWYKYVRQRVPQYPPMYTFEGSRLFRAATSLSNMMFALRLLGLRGLGRKLMGQLPVTMGPGLICNLLHLNVSNGMDLRLRHSLEELIVEQGVVVGAVIVRDGVHRIRIRARRGVLLAAGGFAQNGKMRERHQEGPIGPAWTLAQEDDQGDAVRIGLNIDARIELMDESWWMPVMIDQSTQERFGLIFERSLPHSIMVDSSGRRFMNESQPYSTAGHEIYKRNRTVPAIPSWMILDSRHRKRYSLTEKMRPGKTPQSVFNSGFIFKGETLDELAGKTGLDSQTLRQTVMRFNAMASQGVDEDFGRGGNEYDRFFGDPLVKPNGSLGTIEQGPFYAVNVYPGDLGTKGGLLTDGMARVIGTSDQHIAGLYAAGNTTASVMGRSYPGPGSTLSAAMTFAFVAVNDMAREV